MARGQLHEDTYFYTGKIGSNPGDYLPFPVIRCFLARGRERFDIYCTPCHSRLGDGNGIIRRAASRPSRPPFILNDCARRPWDIFRRNDQRLRRHARYASQITPRDRWCIVAYIRALQLSQGAAAKDVPAGQKVPSEPPTFEQPGSGATLPVIAPKTESKEEGPK